jgi:hypothetical protein
MASAIARLTALAALAFTLTAQTRRLLPVDESGRDPSLVAYLSKFKDAVARQDDSALSELIDPQIKLGFGGEDGIEHFHSDWLLLDRVLRMGGGWKAGSFSIPYVFAKFPDEFDPFDYAAITGQGVWLRAEADATSRGIQQLSYDIVKVKDPGEEWWEVETLTGTRGYVSSRFVASPIGYRAIFTKDQRGVWRMTALLAGD